MSAPDPPLTSESAPSRSVKAANQPRWLDWFAGFEVAICALALVGYGIEFLTQSPLSPGAFVLLMPVVIAWALLIWLNRVELELSPERIVIRSRWRRVMRARPRDLVLPADAAIVSEGGLVRVGGWSAGIWTLQRIAALTEEAGVPLDVRQQPTPKEIRKRRLVALAVTVVLVIVEIVWIVWLRTLSISSLDMIVSVFAGIGSLTFLVLLRLRFRMERAVPGDAIEPIQGL